MTVQCPVIMNERGNDDEVGYPGLEEPIARYAEEREAYPPQATLFSAPACIAHVHDRAFITAFSLQLPLALDPTRVLSRMLPATLVLLEPIIHEYACTISMPLLLKVGAPVATPFCIPGSPYGATLFIVL